MRASFLPIVACALSGGVAAQVPPPGGVPSRVEELEPGRALVLRGLDVRGPVRVRVPAVVMPPLRKDGPGGVIVLEGLRGVTLELDGAPLRGTPAGTDLDQNAGWGIVLRDCQNVVLRGGSLGGYKVCIAAFGCTRLVLEHLRFEGWYGDRLRSTAVAEDPSDWLWPHKNDEHEWILRYGAAIALEDCRDTTIRECRGRRGQNGILLTRCQGTQVYDCDFSFLSGWGLALYRTSDSLVAHNRFDYCVRGYSHGAYWRGQDSAGILMFERSCDNVIARNSATHGGDGVFLFAGRDLVEGLAAARGEPDPGGSDRNIWWQNDFSFAVANAIEATFSSNNWAIGNVLDGSHQHGVWGGYSRRMVVLDNSIRGTLGGGVSIEHGQECAIAGNTFADNEIGLELWWDPDPDLVGGPFGKHNDTSSRDHFVARNTFEDNGRDLLLLETTGTRFGPGQGLGEETERSSTAADRKEPEWLARARAWKPRDLRPLGDLPGARRPIERERPRGLDTIVMGEWGPWDFESGEPRPAQREPGGLLAGCRWDASWFRWTPRQDGRASTGSDPRDDLARWRALASEPLARGEVRAWTDPWGSDKQRRQSVGTAHFGLRAKTALDVRAAGPHRLTVVSDDGVRVLVDGQVALENWTWHGPTRDEVRLELAAGRHELELEYFQIDGAWALSVDLERAP